MQTLYTPPTSSAKSPFAVPLATRMGIHNVFLQNIPQITSVISHPQYFHPLHQSQLACHLVYISKILTFVFDVTGSFFWDMTPCSLRVGTCISEETAAFVFLVPDITSHKTNLSL